MSADMTVDQLLAKQNEARPLATIEPVEGKPDAVKITPWLQSTGCLCASALVIPKAVIASVNPTGKTHHCCGKNLHVVEVTFATGAQVPVADVFAQAASSARVRRMRRRGVRAAAPPCDGCVYAGQVYGYGSVVCMGHILKECGGGGGTPYVWFDIGTC
jgi:hypothetical protein